MMIASSIWAGPRSTRIKRLESTVVVRLFFLYFDRAAASAAAIEDLAFQDRRRWYVDLLVGLLDSNRHKLWHIGCRGNVRAVGRGGPYRTDRALMAVRSRNIFIKTSCLVWRQWQPCATGEFRLSRIALHLQRPHQGFAEQPVSILGAFFVPDWRRFAIAIADR